MKPGTATYERAMVDALESRGCSIVVEDCYRHSRNTFVYRIRRREDGRQLIAKAYFRKPGEHVVEEHRVIQTLHAALDAGGAVTVPAPTACVPELRLLVVEYENGPSIEEVLLDGRRYDATMQREAIQCAANALFVFHNAYGIKGEVGGEISRRYLDPSPINFLWRRRTGVTILLDVPEVAVSGPVHWDVGVFAFELFRIGVRPGNLVHYDFERAKYLRKEFVSAYFANLGRMPSQRDLAAVTDGMRRRCNDVLGWYSKFWTYDSVIAIEFAKAVYFVPILWLFKKVVMNARWELYD